MIVTKTDLDICMVGMTMEDCDEDVWAKRPDGMWSILDSAGNPAPLAHSASFLVEYCAPLTPIGVSERLQTYFANEGVQKAAEAAREPLPSLCGARDHGYELTPDQQPNVLGPCILNAGHYPETMHEAKQVDPTGKFPSLPNVKWGKVAGRNVVQGEFGAFDFVSPELMAAEIGRFIPIDGSTGMVESKALHELVKEGRYFIQSNHSEELMWGCNEHIDTADADVVTGAAFCTGKCTGIVEVLKWIEQHEKEHHADRD